MSFILLYGPIFLKFILKIHLQPIVFTLGSKSTDYHVWLYMIDLISLLMASFQNGASGKVIASL